MLNKAYKDNAYTKVLSDMPKLTSAPKYLPSQKKKPRFNTIAIVKWKIRVTKQFTYAKVTTMTNGCGGRKWETQGEAIIISRRDVETVYRYARTECDLRDHLMIRLPMKIGLRTHEIATLSIEDINFEDRSFQVLDSKKHRFYPLPLDVLTLQLIKDLTDGLQGLVFRHKTYKKNIGKPLTNVAIWKTVRVIGEHAGVKGFHPRVLRHYFVADWHIVQHKSIEALRRILRHKNLSVTHRYLSRLVFFEDIQKEYEETKNPYMSGGIPNMPTQSNLPFGAPQKTKFYEEFCSRCIHEPMCKFKDQMCGCEAASACRFYKQKKEMII